MIPAKHAWITVTLYIIALTFYLIYLYVKSKDKRKLMFSIAFLFAIPSYFALGFGLADFDNANTSIFWGNILAINSLPIIYAIFIAAHDYFLKEKNYEKILSIFIAISICTILFVFTPFNLVISPIPTFIRQILSLEIIVVVIYLYYKTREIENLYFLFFIVSMVLSGIGFDLEFGYFAAFSTIVGYIFLTFLFIQPKNKVKEKRSGISNYFSLEKKIESLEKQYSQLFNSIPDGITLLSTDGTIIDINDSMAKNFNCSKEEFIGKNMHDILPPDVDKKRTDIALKALKTGKVQENDDKREGKYFHNMFVPIETQGNQKNLMVIARNVTKEKKMEEEREEKIRELRDTELATLNIMEDMQETVENLEEARKEILDKNEELKMANQELNVAREQLTDLNENLELKVRKRTEEVRKLIKQKDQFISQLGHDLKTPLTPLNALLPIAQKKVEDEELKKLLGITIQNVNYMKNLVTKTLKLARLNSPGLQLEIKKTNLLEEINKVLEKKELFFENNNIQVENLVDKNIRVDADNLRMEELLDNIISNAVKYSKEGMGKIIINAQENNDEIKLSIKDNGQGMEKDQIEHIFDEFYKADESRHDFESTGLGLTICKRIIDHHGGEIWVESEGLGKGTTFYFTLKKSKN